MFKILRILAKPQLLQACNCPKTPKRTFLSQAYYCKEVWDSRLSSPILQKVNLDLLYHELDQRFQKTCRISAVDVDIFANAIKDDLFIDELMDLVHKLRLTPDTGNTLNSTGHAVIRTLLDHNRLKELLQALDDRLNYGLFLDDYTANILMDYFWKRKDFVGGCIVASQVMLQEDFKHPVTTNFALLHCFNYLLEGGEWPERPKAEEPEEEVKVRVKYLRNPHNDDHFDLAEPGKIVGKTLAEAAKNKNDSLHLSLRVLGLGLLGRNDLIKAELSKNVDLIRETIDLIPEEAEIKKELLGLKLVSEDVASILEKHVTESITVTCEKDIANQCDLFTHWENERIRALEEQKKRLLTAERLAEIERLQQSLKEKEEKLWFFENEEKIELAIEEGEAAVTPEAEKKKVQDEEEAYVPPEVQSRRT